MTMCVLDLLGMSIQIQKKSLSSLSWCFRKLFLFSYCWWRQAIEKDCLLFNRVIISVYIFMWITWNQLVYYIQYHLLKNYWCPHWHCIFIALLVTVKNIFISKKEKLILISILPLLVQLVTHLHLLLLIFLLYKCCEHIILLLLRIAHISVSLVCEAVSLVIQGQLKSVEKSPS